MVTSDGTVEVIPWWAGQAAADSEALKDSAQEVAFALGVIGVLAIPWGKLVASLLGITGVATGSFGFIDPVEGSDSESSGCTDEN